MRTTAWLTRTTAWLTCMMCSPQWNIATKSLSSAVSSQAHDRVRRIAPWPFPQRPALDLYTMSGAEGKSHCVPCIMSARALMHARHADYRKRTRSVYCLTHRLYAGIWGMRSSGGTDGRVTSVLGAL